VLLRPLPYPQSEQLVQLREVSERGGRMAFAEPNFFDLRTRSHTFQMRDVLKLVLRSAMSLVLIGAVLGLAGAYAATRVMSSLLFGVTPTDLATFVAVPVVLFVVALVASLISARRATRVDPLVALRYE